MNADQDLERVATLTGGGPPREADSRGEALTMPATVDLAPPRSPGDTALTIEMGAPSAVDGDDPLDPDDTMLGPGASSDRAPGGGSIFDQRPGSETLRDAAADGPSRLRTIGAEGDGSRYARTRVHGEGGLGVVWSAVDRSIGREVALKELRSGGGPSSRVWSRFLQEARITGQLEHPGIVPIYEVARDPDTGRPYYTMRFVKGLTLAEACARYTARRAADGRGDPLAFRALLDAFVGVCQAVAYAHSRGVIHRDLKGQNVVLGDFGEAIVLDWGLAKVLGEPDDDRVAAIVPDAPDRPGHATVEGQVAGTPSYMPPEQANGEVAKVDRRSDVYSLGAILYEIITGQPPFDRGSAIRTLKRVQQGDLKPPREVDPAAPRALEAICLKAMRRERDDRYQSASDLAAEVRRFLADEPVDAYPEAWTARLARWARKHKATVTTAAILLAASAVGLAVGNVLIGRERDRVRAQREIARRAVDDMYTDVAEQWLEDRSDPLQQQFFERALAAFEAQADDAGDVPSAPPAAPPGRKAEPEDPVRKAFLERSLAYYDDFARYQGEGARSAFQVARARLRKANLERRLGRGAEAEASYRRSIADLAALAEADPGDPAVARTLAIARGQFGAMLVVLGRFGEADPLLADGERAFRALVASKGAVDRDRLEWGRLLRERAERRKLSGDSREAESLYREAIAALAPIATAPGAPAEPRHELAVAQDALGVMLLLQLDRQEEAAKLLGSALALEEGLVRAAPTVPHLRAGLAKTGNTLGLILRAEGKTAEAVRAIDASLAHYRRLADDFPARYEYRRALARAHLNRGNLDLDRGLVAAASSNYERSAALLSALVEEVPEVAKHHRDLAGALNNQGAAREKQDAIEDAAALYGRAAEIDRSLSGRFPAVLEYGEALAIDERNLARVVNRRGNPGDAEAALALASRSLATFEGLSEGHPEIASFRRGVAESRFQLGTIHLMAGRAKEAEPPLRAAVESFRALESRGTPTLAVRRGTVEALVNLAEAAPADAEALDREALARIEALCEGPRGGNADRFTRAVVHNNLGEILEKKGAAKEADALFARASELFGEPGLGGSEPQRLHYLAYVATNRGNLAEASGRAGDSAAFYREAVDRDREAAALAPAYRGFLLQAYNRLGEALIRGGDHRGTAALAAEMLKGLPESNASRVEASSLLARCMGLARLDAQIPEPERLDLARLYAAKGIAQLRVAIDSGYKKFDVLKANPHIRDLMKESEARELLPDLAASLGS